MYGHTGKKVRKGLYSSLWSKRSNKKVQLLTTTSAYQQVARIYAAKMIEDSTARTHAHARTRFDKFILTYYTRMYGSKKLVPRLKALEVYTNNCRTLLRQLNTCDSSSIHMRGEEIRFSAPSNENHV